METIGFTCASCGRAMFGGIRPPRVCNQCRDGLAAASITGVMARYGRRYNPAEIAKECYVLADAMIEAGAYRGQ